MNGSSVGGRSGTWRSASRRTPGDTSSATRGRRPPAGRDSRRARPRHREPDVEHAVLEWQRAAARRRNRPPGTAAGRLAWASTLRPCTFAATGSSLPGSCRSPRRVGHADVEDPVTFGGVHQPHELGETLRRDLAVKRPVRRHRSPAGTAALVGRSWPGCPSDQEVLGAGTSSGASRSRVLAARANAAPARSQLSPKTSAFVACRPRGVTRSPRDSQPRNLSPSPYREARINASRSRAKARLSNSAPIVPASYGSATTKIAK